MVAAYEVPLPTPEERAEFLTLLRRAAEAEGLHMDAASAEDLENLSRVSPMTIHAAVWRGTGDEEALASVMDMPDNLGRPWIAFFKGENPNLAARFRERAMRAILARWSQTQSLPILPTGGLPLAGDLQATAHGYRLKPEAASRYDLPPTSPLVATSKRD